MSEVTRTRPDTAETAAAAALLRIDGLSKNFGGLTALNDVTAEIAPGRIQAIIGPNGAGKTTLFNLITGIYQPTAGEITLRGRSIVGLRPSEIARRGIARTFQTIRLFGGMSVLENVMLGQHGETRSGFLGAALRLPRARREEREMVERARALLERVSLADKAHEEALSLPFGLQRNVEVARALATNPDLLLLDEPASGLNLTERQRLMELIRQIRDEGVTIILVEHDMDVVMELVDEILVLVYGTAIARGTPAEIQENPQVVAAYLGE